MADTNGQRLDRIEQKLDEIAYIMVSLAKAEEKIESLKDDHDRMYERINRLSVKLDDIERKVDENARTVGWINKIVIAAIVAAIGSVVAQYMIV
jgi:predicted  nucleic acid-binding Zn-ribbon protein